MRDTLLREAEKMERQHRLRRVGRRVLACLGVLAVFCTTYALVLPAITKERRMGHTHTEECYRRADTVEQKILDCRVTASGPADAGEGYADFVVHRHDENCYDAAGKRLCTLPEVCAHTHAAACYRDAADEAGRAAVRVEDPEDTALSPADDGAGAAASSADAAGGGASPAAQELVCGKEEVQLHTHGADCLDEEGALVCGKVQVLAHQHTADCFRTETVAVEADALTCQNTDPTHVHDERCYGAWVLVCDKEELQVPDIPDADADAVDAETYAAKQVTLEYYLFLDGERVAVQSGSVLLEQDNDRYYVTAEMLEEVYGDYGFRAADYAGERLFPHTDTNGPDTLWADAPAYQATVEVDGVQKTEWRIPLSRRTTSYVYYLSANTPEADSYFTGSQSRFDADLVRDNTLYRVQVSAPAGQPLAESGVYYVQAGGAFVVDLPEFEGYAWHITNRLSGEELLPESRTELENGRIRYRIADIRCSVKIVAQRGEPTKTQVIAVRYVADTLASQLRGLSHEVSVERQQIVADGQIHGLAKLEERVEVPPDGTYTLRAPDAERLLAEVNTYNQRKKIHYVFAGWRVQGSGEVLAAGQTLSAAEVAAYEADGVLTLEAQWDPFDERGHIVSVNFYLNLHCEIMDNHTNGFVLNPVSDFTQSVYNAGALGTGSHEKVKDGFLLLAPPDSESNAYAVDSILREMGDKAYEGITLSDFPSDREVFAALREGGYTIRISGQTIPTEYLTPDYFQIRWYTLKYLNSDGWHIDGVLVAKEAKLTVTKTFLGDPAMIAAVKAQAGDEEYKIRLADSYENAADSFLSLRPAAEETRANHIGYTAYDAAADTYTWVLSGHVDGGYTLFEQNYLGAGVQGTAFWRIFETAAAQDWQAYDDEEGVGVKMHSYPTDYPEEKYQRLALRNYYIHTGTLRLRKVDSFTLGGLAGVEFQISSTNPRLDFQLYRRVGSSFYTFARSADGDYVEAEQNRIEMDANGEVFLALPAGGYVLTERFPEGYSGLCRIEFAVNAAGEVTEAAGFDAAGNAVEVDAAALGVGGNLLTVKNESRLLTTVTARKDWGATPEDRRQAVRVRLLCNGRTLGAADGLYTQTLGPDNDWTYVWEELPLFVDGQVADYALQEIQIGQVAYDAGLDAADGFRDYAVEYDPAKYREGDAGEYDDPPYWEDADGAAHYARHVLLTVHNRLAGQSGEIEVAKTFEAIGGATVEKIDGVYTFALYDNAAGEGAPIQTATLSYGKGAVTPADGKARFTGLTLGRTYYVFELADDGSPIRDGALAYVDKKPFLVFGGGQGFTLTPEAPTGRASLVNRLNYTGLPATGGRGAAYWIAAGAAACLLAGLALWARRKKPAADA